jgi:enolase
MNQIGTVKETSDLINLARKNNFTTIISHRSGETSDTFMSDLAIASNAEFIKLGAPARGERVAKYNRLIQIYQLNH